MTTLVAKVNAFRPWLFEKWQNDKGLFFVFMEQAIMSGTNFFTNFLIIRMLGSELYGAYCLIISGINMVGGFHSTFILSPLLNFLPGVTEEEQYYSTRQIIFFNQLIFIFLSFVAIYIIFYIYHFVNIPFNFFDYLFASFFLITAIQLQDVVRKLCLVEKKFIWMLIFGLISCIPQVAIIIFSSKITIDFVMKVNAITSLVSVIFAFIFLKGYKRVSIINFKEQAKSIVSFSSSLSIGNVINLLAGFIYNPLYTNFLGLSTYGMLSFVWTIFGPYNVLKGSFNSYLTPKIKAMFKDTSTLIIKKYLKQRMLILLFFTFLYGVVALGVTWFLQNIMGYYTEIRLLSSCVILITILGMVNVFVYSKDLIYVASRMFKVLNLSLLIYQFLNIFFTTIVLYYTRSYELSILVTILSVICIYFVREKWLIKNYMEIRVKLAKPSKIN